MKIKRLEISNCLGLKELQVNPGKINIISGGNEKGKTSILECIEKAINNSERRAKFVKDGEEEATLFVKLDNGYEINRKIKQDDKSTVKVVKDGSSIKKPETVLKNIVGGFNFNPVDFIQKKDKEQTEILLSLINMNITAKMLKEWFGEVPQVDLTQHAVKVLEYLAEKYFYDKRALANGKVKECENEITSIRLQLPDNYNVDYWRNIVIVDKWRLVDKAKDTNKKIADSNNLINNKDVELQNITNKYDLKVKDVDKTLQDKIQITNEQAETWKSKIKLEIQGYENDIKELEQQILDIKEKIKFVEQKIKNFEETNVPAKLESLKNEHNIEIKNINENKTSEVKTFNEKIKAAEQFIKGNKQIDVKPLEEAAEQAEKMKAYIPLADNLTELEDALLNKKDTAKKYDDYVELARRKPAELLKGIKLPVKGLGINDEMKITIDKLPIENLSTSRQIKLALDIAKATSGPLHLICVDRFESLDDEQKRIFFEEAEKDDYQYFITEVTDGELKMETKGTVVI